jgi:hypothetical protein
MIPLARFTRNLSEKKVTSDPRSHSQYVVVPVNVMQLDRVDLGFG